MRGCAWLLVVAVIPLLHASAQGISEMQRRVDTIVAMRDRAAAELTRRQRVTVEPISYPDTVSMLSGTMRVVMQREYLGLAHSAATKAEAFLQRRAGGSTGALAGAVVAIAGDSATRAAHGVNLRFFARGQQIREERAVIANEKSVAQALEEHAQWMLASRDKPVFEAWLTASLPVDSTSNAAWRAIRVELVSSPTLVARRCYAGDLPACKVTLGLTQENDPVMAWYDSAGRRAVARGNRNWDGELPPEAARCLTGSDSVCIAFMRLSKSRPEWVSPPGSQGARMALLQQAFAAHEAGSLKRMAASPDSLERILGAVADMPSDSVIARWLHNVRSGGIESQSAPLHTVLFGLGWVLVMGAVAIRSPRWR